MSKKEEISCKHCGKLFMAYPSQNRQFCSVKCKARFKNNSPGKIGIECLYCHETFFDYPINNRKYCSKKCSGKSKIEIMSGRKLSEEHKQKLRKPKSEEHKKNISKGRKGIKFSEEHRSNLSKANKGKILSEETRKNMSIGQQNRVCCTEETRQKMSKARIGMKFSEEHRKHISEVNFERMKDESRRINLSILNSGPNHPQWRGGISKEPYCCMWTKEYKEEIKERDGYKCQNPMCSHNSERLTCHHINYIKKDCHPKNLITLCVSCNSKANFDRDWHTSFYQEIIRRIYLKAA